MNSTDETLGIFAPRFGALSETFVRRHIQSILPGRTVVVARDILDPDWCPSIPLLDCGSNRSAAREFLAQVLNKPEMDPRTQRIIPFLEKQNVTVAMGEWLNFSALWLPVLRSMGIRYYAHAHGYDITEKAIRRWDTRHLYNRLSGVDGIITVSNVTRQRLTSNLDLDPSRIHVIPCSADIPEQLPERKDSGRILCLHVGRFVEKKGPLLTIKAFQQAHRSNPNLRLEMIGDGKLFTTCKDYCRSNGLSDVVTLHGAMPPDFIKQRLAEADIFVLHSIKASSGNEEGLPVAILEAMAYGLPVASTLHAGIPEAVVDGETGYLVKERDIEAFEERILELAANPDLRRAMGLAGRARAIQKFSAEQEIRRLRELLFGNPQTQQVEGEIQEAA